MPQLGSIFVRVFRGELQNFDFSLLFSVEEQKERKTKILTSYLKKKRKKNLEADPAEVMELVGCRGNEEQ